MTSPSFSPLEQEPIEIPQPNAEQAESAPIFEVEESLLEQEPAPVAEEKTAPLYKPRPAQPAVQPRVQPHHPVDQLTAKIELIMEDGLADVFKELTPVQQQEFKLKGEHTARALRAQLSQARLKVREIFKLILDWLKLLPGVNRFFLEQEAKIKADKIIALKKQS